jgi:hypothetical protein
MYSKLFIFFKNTQPLKINGIYKQIDKLELFLKNSVHVNFGRNFGHCIFLT